MSFLDRSYETLAHADLSQLSRLPMNALPAFDNLPRHAMQHPANGAHTSHPPDRSTSALPKVGETRCYWSLLSPDLRFLYVDPVLASHLAEQADGIIGQSLLAYVHPDEQASAEHDLGSVLESKTLHGSVTRVRYCRLSRVRRMLGHQGPPDPWPDAPKIAVDANYMAVDIVINWSADGLVLCFIHAVVDLTDRDNDENNKTDWTNWCGTPYMSEEQVRKLYAQLVDKVPQPPSMNRVFQILLNQPDRPLWMSWPPDPPQGQEPSSRNFARLAEDVQIGGSAASGTDAKTSCTRRYKALQTMHLQDDSSQEVESIFIPYGQLAPVYTFSPSNVSLNSIYAGSIIFACHRVNSYSKPLTNGGSSISQSVHHSHQPSYDSSISPTSYYEPSVQHSYSHPPVAPPHYNSNQYAPPPPQSSMSHPPPSHHYPWADPGPPAHYQHWSPNPPVGPSSVGGMRSSYPPPPPQQQHQWSSQPPYVDSGHGSAYPYPPPQSVSYSGHSQGSTPVGGGPPSPGSDVVPASRIPRRGASSRDSYGNGGRSAGNPPVGVNKCASCKVTHSPEWRKGPSGKKDLCNACGLRYARSRAKKEGGAQRRRKERVMSSMSDRGHSPSGSPVGIPYSGNDAFSHHASPSPSPPGPGFIPYSHHQQQASASSSSHHHHHPQHHDQQHTQHRTSSHYAPPPPQPSYYSVPPPPPGPPSYPSQQQQAHMHSSRLDPIVPYNPNPTSGGRISPSSPQSTSSPMSTGFSAASFEREKHEQRERLGADVAGTGLGRGALPPTPDSAEPRVNGAKYHASAA
ncbi:hypothetical protein EIP91_009393 [Steccherinum ochraceum]|uniref:GATA-type domain-containing protein n=1 Tax=Steccherinum ochraceum TaxID=92696 RepID=A0A4R0R1P2_9APHY|nr:hypothetical protein EIP91_009393 [Steccherinum ochraceum]